ncbi:MAG: putative quinol monooxygenase [Pseudomonadota bacterium]
MFVLVVEVVVKPGALEDFMPLMETNARASLADEVGCHQFDVVVQRDDPHRILLYEVYDDEAAFQTHKEMPHYKAFDMAAAPLMASKSAQVYDRRVP